MLKELIFAFDCDDGLPESVFNHARIMISATLGEDAAAVFINYIDATDGMFYLKEGTASDCWNDILTVSKDK